MPAAWIRSVARVALPSAWRRPLRKAWKGASLRALLGRVRFGSLRRVTPISRAFGLDRGRAVDRFYIERFLAAHAGDIRGAVLEIGDATYTRQFGAAAVVRSEVLHSAPGNPAATVVGDLTRQDCFATGTFDCIVLTQTLQFIFDVPAAVASAWHWLKPGGLVLATVPGISQISRYDMDRWGDFWRFTSLSARRVFESAFRPELVHVEAHGNVLAATAFLYGLAVEDLLPAELAVDDPDYELLIAVRAVKEQPGP
jgi:SAM-dependent methyltransferase